LPVAQAFSASLRSSYAWVVTLLQGVIDWHRVAPLGFWSG
jgi:hypothetical protein